MTAQRDLFLHIGHFKTGTTALQVFCDTNAALLPRGGLHYAQTARHFAKHSELAFALLHEAGATEMMFGYKPETMAEALWDALLSEARGLPAGHALLASSEEFIRLGAYPEATDLLRRFLADTDDLRIRAVVYLRAPQAHLESYYNQLIKMGIKVPGFDATVCDVLEPVHWDYAQALAPWVEVLGAENVIIRQFSPTLRAENRLVTDFFNALGHQIPEAADYPDQDENPRIDPSLAPILRNLARAELRPRLARTMQSQFQEGLLAERGEGTGSTFAALRDRAEAAIDLIANLPQSRIDRAAMLGDLPHPLAREDRLRDEVTAMLMTEIIELRTLLTQQAARIAALEAQGGAPESEDGTDGPRAAGPRKRARRRKAAKP